MKKLLAVILALSLSGLPSTALAAIAFVSDLLGTDCTENTDDTSLSCTIDAQLDANNVAVFQLSTDNNCNTVGTAVETGLNEHASGTLDGNALTKIWEVCSDVDGSAGTGGTVSLWIIRAVSNIALGATLAFTLTNSRTAKAAVGREFSVTSGNTLQSAGSEQSVAADSADPPSMAISGLANQEYLFWRGMAVEGDSSATFTVTSGYTSVGLAQGGGAGSLGLQARGEYRVFTGTGDTSDPALSSGLDNVSAFVALKEVSTATTRPIAPFIFQ